MKLSTVFLTALLTSSYIAIPTTNEGIYCTELKAFREASETKALFEQDVDGSLSSTHHNLGRYNPIIFDNGERTLFSQFDIIQQILSSGNIQRQILIHKELSCIDRILTIGMCGLSDDLIIVTHQTMPALYNYISSLSDKADIALPFIFISLKNLSTSSRKLLGFRGSIVIGQQLINDLSDQQLESLIAQQIGHIKYIHTNKKAIISGIGLACNAYIIAAICSLLINKRFARHADMFAWQVAGRADGFITFYEELQAKDELKRAEYDEVFTILTENRANISLLSYCILMLNYYVAEAKNYVEGKYSKYAYPSHQERIGAARRYIAQYENIH